MTTLGHGYSECTWTGILGTLALLAKDMGILTTLGHGHSEYTCTLTKDMDILITLGHR